MFGDAFTGRRIWLARRLRDVGLLEWARRLHDDEHLRSSATDRTLQINLESAAETRNCSQIDVADEETLCAPTTEATAQHATDSSLRSDRRSFVVVVID